MTYTVIHAGKKAVFQLTSFNDLFSDIKMKIANSFGLPNDKIFLKNSKEEILLSNQSVVDEIFPLQSSKMKNQD